MTMRGTPLPDDTYVTDVMSALGETWKEREYKHELVAHRMKALGYERKFRPDHLAPEKVDYLARVLAAAKYPDKEWGDLKVSTAELMTDIAAQTLENMYPDEAS